MKNIIYTFLLSVVFLFFNESCVTKIRFIPIENTVFVKDTIFQPVKVDRFVYLPVHDTVYIKVPEYVFVPKYIDTIVYVPKLVKDTVQDVKLIKQYKILQDSLNTLTEQIKLLRSQNLNIKLSKDTLSIKVFNLEDLLVSATDKSNSILWWLLGVLALGISIILYFRNK